MLKLIFIDKGIDGDIVKVTKKWLEELVNQQYEEGVKDGRNSVQSVSPYSPAISYKDVPNWNSTITCTNDNNPNEACQDTISGVTENMYKRWSENND